MSGDCMENCQGERAGLRARQNVESSQGHAHLTPVDPCGWFRNGSITLINYADTLSQVDTDISKGAEFHFQKILTL